MRIRIKSYYQKIILLCLVLVFFLSVIQSGMSFYLLRRQTIEHSDALSERIVHTLSADINDYFDRLDRQLDTVYSYPTILAELNTGTQTKAEMPARALLGQTPFFRYMQCIRIYNRSHTMRSFFTRSTARGAESVDIYAESAAAAIYDYIENETAPFRVFCVEADSGETILRVVKRIYQDKGYTFAGYIVCDIQPMVLKEYVANCVVSPYQYVWISTLNDHSCYLSMKKDDDILALMDGNTWESSDSRMVRGNFYLSSDVGEYGIIVTLFTEEIELRNNYRKILTILGVEAIVLVLVCAAFAGVLRVYLKSQKEEKDESNVEKKWYNKCRRR